MKLINTEHTRSTYAPFGSIEQLNANTMAIRETHSEFLITSEKAVLDVIHRFATKHYGVCYLSKSSIAEKVGLSRRQVIRICQRFEALGIIAQYATDRKRGGGQTSNTIVFLTQLNARAAFVDCENTSVDTVDVTAHDTGLDAPKEALKEKNLKDTKETAQAHEIVKNGLIAKLPKTLQNALAPFFHDINALYSAAGTIFKAKALVDSNIRIEDYENEYYHAVRDVMSAYKRGKVRNVNAVLFTVIKSTTSAIDRRIAYGI